MGLILTLLVESPVMGLQKELLRKLAPASMSKALTLSPGSGSTTGPASITLGASVKNIHTLPSYDQLDRTLDEHQENNNEQDSERDQQYQAPDDRRYKGMFGISLLQRSISGSSQRIRIPDGGDSTTAPLTSHLSAAGDTQV